MAAVGILVSITTNDLVWAGLCALYPVLVLGILVALFRWLDKRY